MRRQHEVTNESFGPAQNNNYNETHISYRKPTTSKINCDNAASVLRFYVAKNRGRNRKYVTSLFIYFSEQVDKNRNDNKHNK